MLFVLISLGLCSDDATFNQPFPVLLKVPVSKTPFKTRMIAIVCSIAAADAVMVTTYVWRCLRHRVVQTSLTEPFIDRADSADIEMPDTEK
jgi:hypothetical protein